MIPLHCFVAAAALLASTGCTDRAFTLRSTEPVVAQDTTCAERTISSRYRNVEIRTDPAEVSEASSGQGTRRVFFDQVDADRFYSEPETRGYSLDWPPAGAKSAPISFQWTKRGESISSTEREHVARRIRQVHRLLSAQCGLPASTIMLAER